MAVLQRIAIEKRHLEVRRAGRTHRLYVDGVLHTQYNPCRAVTGGVWDALGLAPLLQNHGRFPRVLLLGLGGGAAVHLLQRYAQPEAIVAVERDAQIVELARDWFGLATIPSLSIHLDDARAWLRRYQGAPFDVVLEDCCGESLDGAERAFPVDAAWAAALTRVLAPDGMLVVNFLDRRELSVSALCRPPYAKRFPSALWFSHPHCHNAVAAWCSHRVTPRGFWARVYCRRELRRARRQGQLRLSVHRVR